MKKLFALTFAFIALFFVFPKTASAGQVLVYPKVMADTYIDSRNNEIRGSETTATFGYFLNSTESNWAFFKFNVNIPAGATVDHAYLRIMGGMCSGSPNPTNFTIAQVEGSWDERTLSWGNRPSVGNLVTQNSSCISSTSYANYSIKNIAVSWNNGAPNYGVALYGPKNNNWYRQVKTRESGESSEPMMILYYTVPNQTVPSANQGSGSSSSTPGVSTSTGKTTTSATTTSGSNNDKPTGNSAPTKIAETKEDLDNLVRELTAGSSGLSNEERFGIIMMYAWPVLCLLFWILVIVLIIVLVRRKKKKDAGPKSATKTKPNKKPTVPKKK